MPRDLFADLPEYSNQRQPHDLLQGTKVDNSEEQRYPGMLDRLPLQNLIPQSVRQFANNLPANIDAGLLKFGEGLINAPHDEWNIVSPAIGKYIPSMGEHDVSRAMGLPGTTSDKVIQFLAEQAPNFALPGAKAKDALEFAGRASSALQPHKYAEDIIKDLGKSQRMYDNVNGISTAIDTSGRRVGEDNIRDALARNAKEAAADIHNKYKEIKEIGSKKYESIFNDANRLADYRLEASKSLIPEKITKTFGGKLEDRYNDLIKDPTLKNLHEFQSDLGFNIRKLKSQNAAGKLSVGDQKILGDYQRYHGKLQNKIHETLQKAENKYGKSYLEPYLEANKYHYEHVTPYRLNPTISRIANGKLENPGNLISLFKNPERHISKIVEDVGPELKNKLIYAELGKHKGEINPEKLLKSYEDLDKKGLSDYITDELAQKFGTLKKKVRNKDIGIQLGSVLGGGLIGSALPIPFAKELGAGAGFLAAPAIAKLLSSLAKKKGI